MDFTIIPFVRGLPHLALANKRLPTNILWATHIWSCEGELVPLDVSKINISLLDSNLAQHSPITCVYHVRFILAL